MEFILSFPLLVGSFSHSESVYTPSFSSVASTALGSSDSEMNKTHSLPRRNLWPNVGERPMCKELQLRVVSTQSRYLQGRGVGEASRKTLCLSGVKDNEGFPSQAKGEGGSCRKWRETRRGLVCSRN